MKRAGTAIVGVCGEHYVAAYLSGHGLIVALPRGGNPGTDLFAAHPEGGPPVRIQVKTGTKSYGKRKWANGYVYQWPTRSSITSDETLWFVYVYLNGWPSGDKQPELFFVPSADVAKTMAGEANETWPFFWLLAEPAQECKDQNGLRQLMDAIKPKPEPQPPMS